MRPGTEVTVMAMQDRYGLLLSHCLTGVGAGQVSALASICGLPSTPSLVAILHQDQQHYGHGLYHAETSA